MSVPELEAESIATVDIVVDCDGDSIPSVEEMRLWAESAFLEKPSPVHIRIVDSAEMKTLNGQFANRHYATNVLSFPMSEISMTGPQVCRQAEPDMYNLPDELAMLGDIAICAPVVEMEAKEQGKKPGAHWAHMIVHGMLHLQGFDHIREEDAHLMEAQEIRLLNQLGFSNPYVLTNQIGHEIENMQGTSFNDR